MTHDLTMKKKNIKNIKHSMTTRSHHKYPPRKIEFDILGNRIPMKSFKERNISIAQAWVDTTTWSSKSARFKISLLEQAAIKRLIEDFA
jgi:hypothetical protein